MIKDSRQLPPPHRRTIIILPATLSGRSTVTDQQKIIGTAGCCPEIDLHCLWPGLECRGCRANNRGLNWSDNPCPFQLHGSALSLRPLLLRPLSRLLHRVVCGAFSSDPPLLWCYFEYSTTLQTHHVIIIFTKRVARAGGCRRGYCCCPLKLEDINYFRIHLFDMDCTQFVY